MSVFECVMSESVHECATSVSVYENTLYVPEGTEYETIVSLSTPAGVVSAPMRVVSVLMSTVWVPMSTLFTPASVVSAPMSAVSVPLGTVCVSASGLQSAFYNVRASVPVSQSGYNRINAHACSYVPELAWVGLGDASQLRDAGPLSGECASGGLSPLSRISLRIQ